MQSFAIMQWGHKFAGSLVNDWTKYKVIETVNCKMAASLWLSGPCKGLHSVGKRKVR